MAKDREDLLKEKLRVKEEYDRAEKEKDLAK
jgi:hypothetical protein